MESEKSEIYVHSDIGRLQTVLMHRPDHGIERVTPENAVELLYEDIVHLPVMQKEHDWFTQAIGYFIGQDQVLEVQNILRELLQIKSVKSELLNEIAAFENLSTQARNQLQEYEDKELANILINGQDCSEQNTFFEPLPNYIFTRDIGVVINNHILVAQAAKSARKRESILSKFIFRHLVDYREDLLLVPPTVDGISIEGGDIMMLQPGHLLVATSERTTEKAIDWLIEKVFNLNLAERVSKVSLPELRYCMHLDTIFTAIDCNVYIGFAPLISNQGALPVTSYTKSGKENFESLEQLLKSIEPESLVIPCGNNISPFAEREQWTDACNFFTIKPGVAFAYDRNVRTNITLQQSGYRLISAQDLIDQFMKGQITPEQVDKTIITIPSGELSRARGGAALSYYADKERVEIPKTPTPLKFVSSRTLSI